MVQGHAHPAIGKAIGERYIRGTHFAAPTEDAIVVGEELARRWDIHRWRYTNSGSESTMDAIRIARAYTKRHTVMKIFGSYHGHHDGVMVSIGVEYDKIGPHEAPASLPYGAGIPQSVVDEVFSVHFNDPESLDRRIADLDREGRKPACMIMEPAMMNLGVVLPEPGYLEAVREITRKHGVVLIFDEVKTGLCIAAGGAVERFGVMPDIVTLAKALAGGLPSGAIGGSEEVMSSIENGSVYQVGTYNGNPLGMASLTERRLKEDQQRLRTRGATLATKLREARLALAALTTRPPVCPTCASDRAARGFWSRVAKAIEEARCADCAGLARKALSARRGPAERGRPAEDSLVGPGGDR
jgi:glutamate-1-semialdehyde 2,1-aminomutase